MKAHRAASVKTWLIHNAYSVVFIEIGSSKAYFHPSMYICTTRTIQKGTREAARATENRTTRDR